MTNRRKADNAAIVWAKIEARRLINDLDSHKDAAAAEPGRKHVLFCDEYHVHHAPACCSSECWCIKQQISEHTWKILTRLPHYRELSREDLLAKHRAEPVRVGEAQQALAISLGFENWNDMLATFRTTKLEAATNATSRALEPREPHHGQRRVLTGGPNEGSVAIVVRIAKDGDLTLLPLQKASRPGIDWTCKCDGVAHPDVDWCDRCHPPRYFVTRSAHYHFDEVPEASEIRYVFDRQQAKIVLLHVRDDFGWRAAGEDEIEEFEFDFRNSEFDVGMRFGGAEGNEYDSNQLPQWNVDGHEYEDWCENNDCERASCHRCFPRTDCALHGKCREFTERGEAYTEEEAARMGTSALPRYFVCEGWGHIFSDGVERGVRFVYDRTEQRVVAMQIERSTGWAAIHQTGADDVIESLEQNGVFDAVDDLSDEAGVLRIEAGGTLKSCGDYLPEWAASALLPGPEGSQRIVRNESTEKARAIWAAVDKAAARVPPRMRQHVIDVVNSVTGAAPAAPPSAQPYQASDRVERYAHRAATADLAALVRRAAAQKRSVLGCRTVELDLRHLTRHDRFTVTDVREARDSEAGTVVLRGRVDAHAGETVEVSDTTLLALHIVGVLEAAETERAERESETLALSTPAVKAEAHSDDYHHEVDFDAAPWFAQASDEEIENLVDIDWGGNMASDAVALYFDEADPQMTALFMHCRKTHECGFECHVDQDTACAWLEKHRPGLLARLRAAGKNVTALQNPVPFVPAKAWSDDHEYEAAFDAREWFAQAGDEQIIALAECDWGDWVGDDIARYFSDTDERLADLLRYADADADMGFTCKVDEQAVFQWLQTQRPNLLDRLMERELIRVPPPSRQI